VSSPYAPVTNPPLLPPGWRCSAFYWSAGRGLPVTLGWLQELGLRAARLGRRQGIPEIRAPEGPFWVLLWSEDIWAQAKARLDEDLTPVTAHQYAAGARLLCGSGDAEFLTGLVRHAADLAARYGVPAAWDSGYFPVWPGWVWSVTADAMAQAAAEHGDYDPGRGSRQGPWRDPPMADDDVPWDGDDIRAGGWDAGWPPMSADEM
jgi:hypothetical protein